MLLNEYYFMKFFIVAYNAAHSATIMSCATKAEVEAFFHRRRSISINYCFENVHQARSQGSAKGLKHPLNDLEVTWKRMKKKCSSFRGAGTFEPKSWLRV